MSAGPMPGNGSPADAPRSPDRRIDWSRIFGYDIFISYSRHDSSEYAISLERQLNRLELQTFRDDSDLPIGSPLSKTITDAIARSRHMVVVLSQRSLGSAWVEKEVRCAVSHKIDIIPINIDAAITNSESESGLRGLLKEKDYTWIDDLPTGSEPRSASPNTVSAIRHAFRLRRASYMRRMVETIVFIVLSAAATTAAVEWRRAVSELNDVRSRELLLQSDDLHRSKPGEVALSGLLSLEAWLKSHSDAALRQINDRLATLILTRAWSAPLTTNPALVRVHLGASRVTIVQTDRVEARDLSSGKILANWRLPEEVTQKLPGELKDSRLAAAVREDGLWLAYFTSRTSTILVLDLSTGKTLYRIPYPAGILDIDLAKDVLAVVGKDFRVDVWSLRQGSVWKPILSNPPQERDPSGEPIYEIQLARDGKRLAALDRLHAGASTYWPEWTIWNLEQTEPEAASEAESDMAAAVFVPDAKSIFFLRQGRIQGRHGISIPSLGASSLRMSQQGKLLAAAGLDGVRIWQVAELMKGSPHLQPLSFLRSEMLGQETLKDLQESTALGTDGCLLATAANEVASVWDCIRNMALARIPTPGAIQSIHLAPEFGVAVIQTASNVEAVPFHPPAVEFNTEGDEIDRVIVRGERILSCNKTTLSYWDLNTGQLLRRIKPGPPSYGDEQPPEYSYEWCSLMGDNSSALFQSFAHTGEGGHSLEGVVDLRSSDVPQDRYATGSEISEAIRTSTSLIEKDDTGSLAAFSPYVSTLFNVRPRTPTWRCPIAPLNDDIVVANPEGVEVAVVRHTEVHVFDSKANSQVASWTEEFDPGYIRFFADSIVLNGTGKATIREFSGRLRGSITIQKNALVCGLSRGGNYATVCVLPPDEYQEGPEGHSVLGIQLYRVRDGVRLKQFNIGEETAGGEASVRYRNSDLLARFSPDAKLWAAFGEKNLVVIDLSRGTQILALDVQGNWPPPFDLTDSRLAVARRSEVEIYEPSSRRIMNRVDYGSTIEGVAWTGPQSILCWGQDRIHGRTLSTDPAAALCSGLKTSLSSAEWKLYFPHEAQRDSCEAWRQEHDRMPLTPMGIWKSLRSRHW